MKFRKPRGVLLGLGLGSFVIGALLFFLVPVICREGFSYSGLNAFVEGVKALFTFNFANVLYTALFILLVIAIAGIIMYVVMAISKKFKLHILFAILTLVFIFGSYFLVSSYFLADVEFNGASGKLLSSMLAADGQMLGKILSSVALAFIILSNVLLIVHMFVVMVSMAVTKQIEDFEEKVVAEKEKEVEEKVAAAIAEATPEQVFVEAVKNVEKPEPDDDLETRKAKEMKLFKECIDTGYFSEYEEIEFPDPIEGVTEEPVYEGSVVEEKSAFVYKKSVHVGFTHE